METATIARVWPRRSLLILPTNLSILLITLLRLEKGAGDRDLPISIFQQETRLDPPQNPTTPLLDRLERLPTPILQKGDGSPGEQPLQLSRRRTRYPTNHAAHRPASPGTEVHRTNSVGSRNVSLEGLGRGLSGPTTSFASWISKMINGVWRSKDLLSYAFFPTASRGYCRHSSRARKAIALFWKVDSLAPEVE
jgi:hypothetical protein